MKAEAVRGNARWTRRRFVAAAAGALAWPPQLLFPAATKAAGDPWAGPFDRAMNKFMEERKVPAGALAVVKDRRLVYARGYGWADREKQIPVRPDSLFRLASVSKPVTALAVLRLAEKGKIDLAARPFHLLGLQNQIPKDAKFDDRWREITVRQLLHHTGGWDRDKSFDPMFRPIEIADELGAPRPAGAGAVIRYMLGHPLDFDPGTRYAYSNFGYCLLGRLIEQAARQPYEKFVRGKILGPIGIRRMQIGASLDGKQAPGEVRYYTSKPDLAVNVFPDGPKKVPFPYGGFHLEAMDAHGGWIASVIDLARIAAALDEPERSPILKPETMRTMYEAPAPPVSRKADGALEDSWYACGWMVRPTPDGKANYWHTGSLPGTSTLFVRRGDGISFAALFNQRSGNDGPIDALLNAAANEIETWPKINLFGRA